MPQTQRRPGRQVRRWATMLLVLSLLALLFPRAAQAHPLGNFSVNRYSRLEVGPEQVALFYVLDMAEIPTFQARGEVDQDGDGTISDGEASAYGERLAAQIAPNLRLTIQGEPVAWRADSQQLTFPEGQGGLATTRLELRWLAALPEGGREGWAVSYQDNNFADRLGWQEVIVRPLAGAALLEGSVSSEDRSDALRRYPNDLLQQPLATNAATFRFGLGSAPTLAAAQAEPLSASAPEGFAALVAGPRLSGGALLLALLASFGFGAAHALTPGHGKTIVAAYLVGTRGTARHAIFLGLTTTITHTAGVFLLGFATLFLSRYILPERLYPWLELISGLLVVAIGGSLVVQRLRGLRHASHDHIHDHDHDHAHDHDHDHSHSHLPPGADGQPVTWRSLLALGVSGGLLPCPEAIVVLFGAMTLGRVGLGMLLIFVFSLGLASVLTAIGLLLVRARSLFERLPVSGQLSKGLALGSALFITVAGLALTLQALAHTGLVESLALLSAF